jgi:hypothetical protein
MLISISTKAQVNAAVVGVHNGMYVTTLNYFPNIIHPIEDLAPFTFRVYQITHRGHNAKPTPPPTDKSSQQSSSTSIELESGVPTRVSHRRSTLRELTGLAANPEEPKPRVPSKILSPLNILSVGSFFLTLGLLIWAAVIEDGTAIVALGTISLASSIVGYASWWSPELMNRTSRARVPPGDMVIRTREGAFLLIICNEDVARELYIGTEECVYKVQTQKYRVLVAFGTFLLMVSVVLLGNCNFTMQAAIGASYIVLNGLFWCSALVEKGCFWDLSGYEWEDITPEDAANADLKQDDTLGGMPSFTRTMWYAIRETKKTGWVTKGGAAPSTPQWDEWLKLAEMNAKNENRKWDAVGQREHIVGQVESIPQARSADHDTAEQHVPAIEVPPQQRK